VVGGGCVENELGSQAEEGLMEKGETAQVVVSNVRYTRQELMEAHGEARPATQGGFGAVVI